jgi:hypothetical protein
MPAPAQATEMYVAQKFIITVPYEVEFAVSSYQTERSQTASGNKSQVVLED